MRGDDGLGPELLRQIYEKGQDKDRVFILNCESTPENYTSRIREVDPSHILIVDAVELDAKPGDIVIIKKEQIDTFNISTHTMPVSFLIGYLEKTLNVKVLTIGIQPKEMNLINFISKPVMDSVDELSDVLIKLL